MSERVDLERLRTPEPAPEPRRVVRCVSEHELSALVAVVDAAREVLRTADIWPLRAALEPFTPRYDETSTLPTPGFNDARAWEEVDRSNAEQTTGPCMGARDERCDPRPGMCACFDRPPVKSPHDRRAWEEVDRWNAEQARAERDLAVKAAVDAAKPNPRDRARDQLADAGVTVQRQFRSDQERIAELEELVENLEAREQELYSEGRRIERERGEALDAAKSLAAIVEGFLRDKVAEQDGSKP